VGRTAQLLDPGLRGRIIVTNWSERRRGFVSFYFYYRGNSRLLMLYLIT